MWSWLRWVFSSNTPKTEAGKGQSYEIVKDGKAIHCLLCGLTSHHPEDVRQRFCVRCNYFHRLTLRPGEFRL